MIICVRPNLQIDFETSLRIYKSLGIKHIRFDIKNIPESKKDQYLEIFQKYHALVKEAGMSFAEFHCFALSDIDKFERLALFYLKLMKLCGAKYLSQHIKAELMEYPDRMNKIIKQFKDAGIYFCLENMEEKYWLSNFEIIDDVLSKLPDANLAFDTGHAILSGIDLDEFYENYENKIKVIHLHDVVESDHEIPFTGKLLEQHSFVKKLRQFEHPIVLEIRGFTPDMIEQRYRKSFENTKKFLLV